MIIWFLENGILGQSFRALHVESWRRWWTFVICFVLPKDHRINPQSASLALNVSYTWVGKWWGWRRRRSPWSSPSPYLSFSVFSLRVCWRCWSGTLDNVVFPFALFGGSCWVCVGNIAVCVGFNCWSRSLFVLKSICKLFFYRVGEWDIRQIFNTRNFTRNIFQTLETDFINFFHHVIVRDFMQIHENFKYFLLCHSSHSPAWSVMDWVIVSFYGGLSHSRTGLKCVWNEYVILWMTFTF